MLRLLDPVQLSEGQEVKLTILAIGDSVQLTREEIDRRLRAAGLWVDVEKLLSDEEKTAIDELEKLSEEQIEAELEQLSWLFSDQRRSIDELIDEDRGVY